MSHSMGWRDFQLALLAEVRRGFLGFGFEGFLTVEVFPVDVDGRQFKYDVSNEVDVPEEDEPEGYRHAPEDEDDEG